MCVYIQYGLQSPFELHSQGVRSVNSKSMVYESEVIFLSRINEIISKYEAFTIYRTHPRNTTANKIKLKLHASRAFTWEHILTTLLSHIHKSVVLQYPDSVYMFVTGLDRFGGMME